MNISRLIRVTWIILALTVSSGVAFSGNQATDKKPNKTQPTRSAIHFISDLSEYQKERITSMEAEHQKAMGKLQKKDESSSGKEQKAEIRKQSAKQIENHQNNIKSVLSADQQKQYIMHQLNAGNKNMQMQKQGSGKGSGKGRGSGQGRGQGQGMGGQGRY